MIKSRRNASQKFITNSNEIQVGIQMAAFAPLFSCRGSAEFQHPCTPLIPLCTHAGKRVLPLHLPLHTSSERTLEQKFGVRKTVIDINYD